MKFDQLAQEMVEATSRLVRMRTINIMDTDGIIIASTEADRIGSFHKGAQEVIRTGKPVYIRKNSIDLYPGSKEGCNMPIFGLEGQIIGVVGIYGEPHTVEDAAHLLAVYTTQYFAQNAANQQQMVESELRGKLLRILLSIDNTEHESVIDLCQALDIKFQLPVRVLVIRLVVEIDSIHRLHLLRPVINELHSCGLLRPKNDVWAVEDGRLILIKSRMGGLDSNFLQQLHSAFSARIDLPFSLSAGTQCSKLGEIKASYAEALVLDEIGDEPINDMSDPHCRFRYFLHCSCNQNKAYIGEMYHRLLETFGIRELDVMLATAACYYAQGSSVNRAADLLHIHKNTLQYRMHKSWDALGISECSAFEREYFLRLCIGYHAQIQSRRA